MASIVKYFPLSIYGAPYHNATSYGISSRAFTADFLYESGDYDGTVSIYFEPILNSNNATATAYAELYNYTDSASVSGSELSTANTTPTRLRSGALTLTTGKRYGIRLKISNVSYRAYAYGARLIIKQSGTITKTATAIMLNGYDSSVPANTYADPTYMGYYKHLTANFGGTVAAYFEAQGRIGTVDGTNTLWCDLTDIANNSVSGAELQIKADATKEYQRSGAITLANDTIYKARQKYTTGVGYNSATFIIIKQTDIGDGDKTITFSHQPLLATADAAASTSTNTGFIEYNPTDWDGSAIAVYLVATTTSSGNSENKIITLVTSAPADFDSITYTEQAKTYQIGLIDTPTTADYFQFKMTGSATYNAAGQGIGFAVLVTLGTAGASVELAKVNGIALASIAKYQGIAKASVKKVNGLTIQ